MKLKIATFTFFLLMLSCYSMRADSWSDPQWKRMLDSSDVIALVEYISEGEFRAKAKPVNVYKGELNIEEIWISGFSNRYGPIDKMSPGDRYLVFLNKYNPSPGDLKYWKKRLKEKPELIHYFNALKSGNAYYVWTPTSGDLKVKGNEVQYDLLQTSYYSKQSFYPLDEFEVFLKTTISSNKSLFHQKILKKLAGELNTENTTQYLSMLYLTSFQSFDSLFQKIADQQQPRTCFALAKLLGEIKGKESRDLLVQLLNHQNGLVQGEVVRQLSNEAPEFIGPIFLAHLNSASEEGSYPSNIMDPVRNSIDGGKIELIKTLGKIKYKPAAKKLLPLLITEDDYIFKLLVEVLIQLENKDFIPHLNKHLKNRTESLIFEICSIITDHNLIECKPALMEFITNHNRNNHIGFEYTISHYLGIAHFDDQETRDFLLKDFENLLTKNDTINSDKLNNWIQQYIETFQNLKCNEARPLIYLSLFKWFGYHQDFAFHPELFKVKNKIEDTLNQKALNILKDFEVEEIQSIAFINNTSEFDENFIPSYDQSFFIKLKPIEGNQESNKEYWQSLDKVREKLSKELNISIERISSRRGTYVSSSDIDERFDGEIDWSPMNPFYKYTKELPNKNDLIFLKALAESGFAKKDFDKRQLNNTIKVIEEKLK